MKPSPGKALDSWHIDAVALAVCAALTAALYFAGLRPLLAGQEQHRAQARELSTARQELSTLRASLTSMTRRLEDVRQRSDDASVKLLSATELNQRLAELTKLAGRCELTIDSIHPGSPASGPRYDVVPIVVSGSGSYQASMTFMARLNETLDDTGIASFSLGRGGAAGPPGSGSSFRFDLLWYTSPSLAAVEP